MSVSCFDLVSQTFFVFFVLKCHREKLTTKDTYKPHTHTTEDPIYTAQREREQSAEREAAHRNGGAADRIQSERRAHENANARNAAPAQRLKETKRTKQTKEFKRRREHTTNTANSTENGTKYGRERARRRKSNRRTNRRMQRNVYSMVRIADGLHRTICRAPYTRIRSCDRSFCGSSVRVVRSD